VSACPVHLFLTPAPQAHCSFVSVPSQTLP
jgi:hypothetical protein